MLMLSSGIGSEPDLLQLPGIMQFACTADMAHNFYRSLWLICKFQHVEWACRLTINLWGNKMLES
jgi:hypothetical protein